MSARPGDWSLLQLAGDPFPGDENAVSQQAGHYQNVADAISDQITTLRKIGNGDAQGLYVDKLTDDAKDIANDLSKVHNRFSTVASQLKVWAPELGKARSTSATLLREAEAAHSSMASNQPPTTPLPHDATPAQVSAEKSRSQNYSTAQGDLHRYVTAMANEITYVRGIAKTVANKISDAAHDDVKDSWWDSHVRKWIQDHAHLIDIIVKVLEFVAIAIAVVALVLATGGFGVFAFLGATPELLAGMATFASAMEWVGAAASLGMLAGQGAEKFAGVNDVSWTDIILDVVSLATFGTGKLLGKAADASLKVGSSAAKSEVTDTAIKGLSPMVKGGLKIGKVTNPLRVWAAGQKSAAVAAARGGLKAALEVVPKSLSINVTGSRELAEALAKAHVLENYPSASAAAARVLRLTRGGIAASVVDRIHLVYDLPKLPKTLHELTGGEGEEGGG